VPVAATAVLVLLSAVSLGRGDFPIGILDVLRTLVGLGEGAQDFIVLELRAPRIVVGLLVGLALGVAGALFQTFARNPLASPDTLGITMGASVGAVAAIVLSGGALSGLGVPLAALLGALGTGALLFLLAWRAGIDGYRLVLVGIALWSFGTALVDWLLTDAEIYDAASAYVWITGSLNARTWHHALPLAVALAILLPLALALSRVLRILQLGDDTARGLGVRLQSAQAATVLVAVGCVAFAVSAAGPITFVALVVPQIAVRLTGGARPPLLASGLLGAVLVVGADLVTRTVLPQALPVGILTAVLGAPYLLWLLIRGRRRSTL
jgi:ABC-type enterobactin transport system permease subunit